MTKDDNTNEIDYAYDQKLKIGVSSDCYKLLKDLSQRESESIQYISSEILEGQIKDIYRRGFSDE